MQWIPYNGHHIQPTPLQRADTGKWTVSVSIITDIGDKTQSTPFGSTSPECDTREEAMRHSVEYGKALIDGKVPGVSI